jgi:hypothetical protein
VCTRIYRFFNPERDEESSDYHSSLSSSSSSSSSSSRRRFRNCFDTFFALLERDNTLEPGRAHESRRAITPLSLSWVSFRLLSSSRQTRRESDTRLSFSSVESGEFNFGSRAHPEGGEMQKKSNQNPEEEKNDGRKGGEVDGGKTRTQKSIPPGRRVVLSIHPQSTSLPSSSAPSHPDSDPATNLQSSRFSSFRS